MALATAVIAHGLAVLGLCWAGGNPVEDRFQPLAVMEFAHFDPDGGEPGGGLGEATPTTTEEAVSAVEEPTPLNPEIPPEPEISPPSESEPEPVPEVLESVSEKAAPAPTPPQIKPKPKKQPKPKAKPSPSIEKPGEVKPPKGAGEGAPGQAAGGGPGSGRGGVGGGTGQGNPDALKAYAAKVRQRLERSKKYPSAALAQKISGQATVRFTLDRQGRVLSSVLVGSSGQAVLDEEVMALVKRVSPLPPMPKELPQNTLTLTIPIRFSVR